MFCPKCNTNEGIKWFLRHQSATENDELDVANVITILCTKCGNNQSYMLSDCLDDIFPDWSELKQNTGFDFDTLGGLFGGAGGIDDFDPMIPDDPGNTMEWPIIENDPAAREE